MIIDISEDGYTIVWTSMVTGERKNASIVQLIDAFEAEPIVRCKECFVQKICRLAQFLGNEGYCSQGERKDEVGE